jgi:excisionase family DNA binding protein
LNGSYFGVSSRVRGAEGVVSRAQICRPAQAAHRLGVGRTTVYELTTAGELEVVHIGRGARIPAASLDAFVERIRDQSVTNR